MTTHDSGIDAARTTAILASMAGFPFLLVMGCAWLLAGALTYVVPAAIAPWLYPFLGLPGMGAAILLERRIGYVSAPDPDPLLPLTLQLLFVQIVAFPAILLVWDASPAYMPAAFAAVVGAHFLPFQWVYRTSVYGVLGMTVAVGPYALIILFREAALHYTGFFVGAALLAGAAAVRAHARSVLRAAGLAPHAPPVPS